MSADLDKSMNARLHAKRAVQNLFAAITRALCLAPRGDPPLSSTLASIHIGVIISKPRNLSVASRECRSVIFAIHGRFRGSGVCVQTEMRCDEVNRIRCLCLPGAGPVGRKLIIPTHPVLSTRRIFPRYYIYNLLGSVIW